MAKESREKEILWESCGRCPFFGIPLTKHKYILYEDSISVTKGIVLRTTQTVPLYRIAAKEINMSAMGRRFKCGLLRLITRGHELPDLELLVKHPQEVANIIDKAIEDERKRFAAQRAKSRPYQKSGANRREDNDGTHC